LFFTSQSVYSIAVYSEQTSIGLSFSKVGIFCNKTKKPKIEITRWGTDGTPLFHGSYHPPFLKTWTVLHCISNLSSQFSQ